jgi:hypothetical protein
VLRSHFIPTMDTLGLVIFGLSTALFVSAVVWVFYIALEPYVRRIWPQTIISWSRLIGGRWRDPLVGRDLLFGVILGVAWDFVFALGNFFQIRAGSSPLLANSEVLAGVRETVTLGLLNVIGSIRTTVIFFFLLVLLRVLVKNRWLAAGIFVLLLTVPRFLGSEHPFIDAPVLLVIYSIAAFAVVRFGLIVLVVGAFCADAIVNVPITLDFSNWYAARSLCAVLGIVLVAAWGFYTSLAGQRLWKEDLFE